MLSCHLTNFQGLPFLTQPILIAYRQVHHEKDYSASVLYLKEVHSTVDVEISLAAVPDSIKMV